MKKKWLGDLWSFGLVYESQSQPYKIDSFLLDVRPQKGLKQFPFTTNDASSHI